MNRQPKRVLRTWVPVTVTLIILVGIAAGLYVLASCVANQNNDYYIQYRMR